MLEATATIIEVSHGEKPRAVIQYVDGVTTEDVPESIYEILRSHRGDVEFFSKCEVVKIESRLPGLASITIVDTPGLSSLTEANQRRSRDYVRESDVVLWVLNANHLGQVDVKDEMAHVARMGKPIVAIVNRMDEVESSPDRVIRYVEQELAAYVRAVFPLSARNAYDAVMRDDEEAKQASGFAEIMRFLREEIREERDRVKFDSVKSSINAILRQDQVYHESFLRQLAFIREQVAKYHEELDYRRVTVEDRIRTLLESRIHMGFLSKELSQLDEEMKRIRFLHIPAPVQKIVEHMFSQDAVSEFWDRLKDDIQKEYEATWQESINELDITFARNIETSLKKESEAVQLSIAKISPGAGAEVAKKAFEGGAIGGAAGAGLAVYAAVLGPAAAYVTLGSALAAVVPPLAIAGIAAGTAAGLLRQSQEKDRLRKEVTSKVSELRNKLKRHADTEILPRLREESRRIVDQLSSRFAQQLYNGWGEADVDSLEQDTRAYLESTSIMLASAP